MPKHLVQTPEEEECWERARELATEHFGHRPKEAIEWAYVTGIYQHMCHLKDIEGDDIEGEDIEAEDIEIRLWRNERPQRPRRPSRYQ